jgi:hypothetical protein
MVVLAQIVTASSSPPPLGGQVGASPDSLAVVTAVAALLAAVGSLIAAFVAGVAAWFSFMPWCDLFGVEFVVVESGNAVEMRATVHNAGRGQALVAKWSLVSYEGMANLPHATAYLGPLFPDERRPINHTVQLPTPVQQKLDPGYAMILRWSALFGVYGETFIETYPVRSHRKRLRVCWSPHGAPEGIA